MSAVKLSYLTGLWYTWRFMPTAGDMLRFSTSPFAHILQGVIGSDRTSVGYPSVSEAELNNMGK